MRGRRLGLLMATPGAVALAMATLLPACASGDSSVAATESTTSTAVPATSTSTTATVAETPMTPAGTTTLVDFPGPTSVAGWRSVDDSVMGGISVSTTSWADGALVFQGRMTTESNGGFTSTLGPVDRGLGRAAVGAAYLGVDAVGDGRTYVLQVRAGGDGFDLWIARFTPVGSGDRTGADRVSIPLGSFAPVDRFLRPRTSAEPLDPSTITQLAVYLIDGQVGQFRLALRSIVAERR